MMTPQDVQRIASLLTGQIDQIIRNQIKPILAQNAPIFDFATCYLQNGYNAENNFKLYITTGRCLQEMNRHAEALVLFQQMNQHDPQVLLATGRCWQEMNRHAEAPHISQNVNALFGTAMSTSGARGTTMAHNVASTVRYYSSPFDLPAVFPEF